MLSLSTQNYGRVKTVKKIPVVTQFLIFHQLPVIPLQSVYDLGYARNIPFAAQSSDTIIQGLKLARIDIASVLIAYARYFFGGLAVLGGLVSGILTAGYFAGQAFDDVGWTVFKTSTGIFAVGLAGTILTYWVPLLSERERKIRELCSELLEMAIDPAMITAKDCAPIAEFISSSSTTFNQRDQLIAALISARISISGNANIQEMEHATDRLLDQLVTQR